jgi:Transcriptional regulator, AbiEi antitoxin
MLRARDLKLDPNSRRYLARLAERGLIERVGRGIYTTTAGEISEHHTLAEASLRVPHAVICLLSALRFYDLTTEAPFATWIAIENKARTPKLDYPHLQVVRMSGASLISGIEEHLIEGVRVRVYTPAKTVADCFKFRSRIGLDVAIIVGSASAVWMSFGNMPRFAALPASSSPIWRCWDEQSEMHAVRLGRSSVLSSLSRKN